MGRVRFSKNVNPALNDYSAERLLGKGCQCASNNVSAENQKRDKENLSKPSLGQSTSNTLTQDHPEYCGKHCTEGKNAVRDSQNVGFLQCDRERQSRRRKQYSHC